MSFDQVDQWHLKSGSADAAERKRRALFRSGKNKLNQLKSKKSEDIGPGIDPGGTPGAPDPDFGQPTPALRRRGRGRTFSGELRQNFSGRKTFCLLKVPLFQRGSLSSASGQRLPVGRRRHAVQAPLHHSWNLDTDKKWKFFSVLY